MKVYISGPITGHPNLNRSAFDQAVAEIVALGVEAVNPHTIAGPTPEIIASWQTENEKWEWFMRNDIKTLVDCDALFMLDGWQFSRGASIEAMLARDVGLRVFYSLDALRAYREMILEVSR